MRPGSRQAVPSSLSWAQGGGSAGKKFAALSCVLFPPARCDGAAISANAVPAGCDGDGSAVAANAVPAGCDGDGAAVSGNAIETMTRYPIR